LIIILSYYSTMYMASVFLLRADHSSRGVLPTVMRRV